MSINQQQFLGNYLIGKNIGQGTFGKVRLGTHTITQQKVAVKTLQKQKIIQQQDIKRVTRQICILKILRHPNIIQLYEIIETKTDIHLIMQYASGGELFDYIVKNKRLDQNQAVRFMQQIVSGVQYIHQNGIVHRDLKPENLLLDQYNNIKIVDFGLSNQYKPGEKLITGCGSPCYAAPEMILGIKYDCLNVDIWSCGIILYAMLCGYLPFEDPNINKIYKKIISGQFQMPSKILPNNAQEIIKNILKVNPDDRFNIQQIKDSKWFNIINPHYQAKGIIVGKDSIIPNEKNITKMTKYNIQPTKIRKYVSNNRHNHITAFYYLLQLQLSKSSENDNSIEKNRDISPMIYRPQEKNDNYVVNKKVSSNKDHSKNHSLNISNIIISLIQANNNKLINNNYKINKNNFQKREESKIFPKNNNSTIHDSNSANKSTANQSVIQEKLFQNSQKTFSNTKNQKNISFKSNNEFPIHSIPIKGSYSIEQQCVAKYPVNTKRQQLSEQLKKISMKIDKEILQLKLKNNSIATQSLNTERQMNIQKYSSSTKKKQSDRLTNSLHSKKQILQQFNINAINTGPTLHVGPFNTRCLFMENANKLNQKILEFFQRNKITYQKSGPYMFDLQQKENIKIEALQGYTGFHLVKFSKDTPINQRIIQQLQI